MIYKYIDFDGQKYKGGFYLKKSEYSRSRHYIESPLFFKENSPIAFFNNLKLLTSEGYSVANAIKILKTSNSAALKRSMAEKMEQDLKLGKPFFAVVQKYFEVDDFVIFMLEIAEKEANINEVLDDICDYLEKKATYKRKIKNETAYPIFLMVMGIILLFFISKFVAPVFFNVLESFEGNLPKVSLVAFSFASFISNYGDYVLFAIILIYIMYFMISTKFPMVQFKVKKNLYQNGLFKNIRQDKFQYNFFKRFSILYKYKGNFKDSLIFIAKQEKDIYFKSELEKAIKNLGSGKSISEIVEFRAVFSDFAISFMEGIDRDEEVFKTTDKLAKFYEQSYGDRLSKVLKLIGPIMIAIIGVIVAIIALGIMLPIFSFTEEI